MSYEIREVKGNTPVPTAWPKIGIQATGYPNDFRPVLALIQTIGELGRSEWREVVYHDEVKWCSYAGSDTFNDGERVVSWIYADECV